ncbi:hypothetical protein [Caulobacter sp. B11]|uniref:hypothetical protein n=1 Tax=Caulobacter sp. B11 TaxID=2048899 RepID=UPI001F32EA2C|nr:hypothetical protein [Caulobacter sp. B11]
MEGGRHRLALIGAIVLLLGSFELLLALPMFASLRQPGVAGQALRDRGDLALTALLPALTYFPLFILGMVALRPTRSSSRGSPTR